MTRTAIRNSAKKRRALARIGPGWLLHLLPLKQAFTALALSLGALGASAAQAGEAMIAAAANFTDAAREIGAAFEKTTGHKAIFSFGSTGLIYAQIVQDAPFDVFLSADREQARKAVEIGRGVEDTRFTYATGRIVLFSRDPALVTGGDTLRAGNFTRLAIANPETAPYGSAAIETMKALRVHDLVSGRVVQGKNIAQAYQFVATGNAELGFVALSQIVNNTDGSRWLVPQDLHTPIRQDAVLLRKAAGNEAAQAFLAFLKGPEARAIMEKHGYGTGE